MTEKKLKSAYELAMERLRRQDHERGTAENIPLDEAQKAEIADLRARTRARRAEMEILHRKDLAAAAGDPERTREIEQRYRVDRDRLESALESAIARVRSGRPGRLEE